LTAAAGVTRRWFLVYAILAIGLVLIVVAWTYCIQLDANPPVPAILG